MKLTWSAKSCRNLVEFFDYISLDNPVSARAFVKRLRERARRIPEHPYAGRVVPEISRPDVREVMLGNYRIVYRVCRSEVQVLTIQEGHRTLKTVD